MKRLLLSIILCLPLIAASGLANPAFEETWTLFVVLDSAEADIPGETYKLLMAHAQLDEGAAKAVAQLARESVRGAATLAKTLIKSLCDEGPVLEANVDALATRTEENDAAYEAFKAEQAEAMKALLTPAEYGRVMFYVRAQIHTTSHGAKTDAAKMIRDGEITPQEVVQRSCETSKGEPR